MIRAVVFDFFGVVYSDEHNEWLSASGFQRTGEFAQASNPADTGQVTRDQFFARLSELGHQPVDTIKAKFASSSVINSSVIRLVLDLKNTGYTIGMLSNSNAEHLRELLEKNQIIGLFDSLTVSGEVGVAKPDQAIFKMMLTKLGLSADEVLFIDDNPSNTVAAESFGIKSIKFEDAAKLRQNLVELKLLKN